VKFKSSSDHQIHKPVHPLNTSSTRGFVHGIPTADEVASSLWSRIRNATT
jgi:hypothetical protein